MRILLDLRSAHPGLTGIGRYAVNMALSLETVAGDHEVCGITSASGAEYLRQQGVKAELYLAPPDPEWDEKGLSAFLRGLEADVFHSPLFVLPPAPPCSTICTIHDVIPLVRPDLSSPRFRSFFASHVEHALRSASRIVTVSEYSKRDLLGQFPNAGHRVCAIHEPVSPMFRPRPAHEVLPVLRWLGLETGYILSVGAIDRRKNLGRLIEAFARLRGKGLDVPLVVVGDASGDGFDPRAEADRHSVSAHVRFLGRVSDATLAHLYCGAGVFAFPSLYEGFGLPVLEAMASGTPVVASDTTSVPEIAGDAAVLVDPLRVEAIEEALVRVFGDPTLRARLREAGTRRASEFTLEAQGTAFLNLYSETLVRAS